jgi:hypothetical protein
MALDKILAFGEMHAPSIDDDVLRINGAPPHRTIDDPRPLDEWHVKELPLELPEVGAFYTIRIDTTDETWRHTLCLIGDKKDAEYGKAGSETSSFTPATHIIKYHGIWQCTKCVYKKNSLSLEFKKYSG